MHTLYTLGYTGTKPEHILIKAQQLGAMVVDCRFSPRSRAPQWTRKQLSELLGQNYRHIPALGNVNYKGDGPIVISNPAFRVPQVELYLKSQSVILLCVCKEFCTCHRAVVANLVKEACGCEIMHITAADLLKPSQPDQLFAQVDYGVNPAPIPADMGGTLTLRTQTLPLHQTKMF